MPLPVTRLRRWFALGAVVMIALVAGLYLLARWRVRNVVREVPKKIGIEVQQTAEGFSISKSDQGRTLFTVTASRAVQFKKGGLTELHAVAITVYGKDASRFDRIAGADFEFDPASGEVTAKGPVEIDLEGNPQGLLRPDQAPPAEMKNPIHIETSGLVFNRDSGNASVHGRIMLQTGQASGTAVGMQYVAKTRTLSLLSDIAIDISSPHEAHLTADHGVITKDPRQIVLSQPQMTRDQQKLRSDKATLFLRDDNTVDRVLAEGGIRSELHGRSDTSARSDRAELFLTGAQNLLRAAILTGSVQLAVLGAQPAEAYAGRATLRFAGKEILQTVHAEDGVRLVQTKVQTSGSASTGSSTTPGLAASTQDVEMTAPAMDFLVKGGRRLERAQTSGPPQIVITQAGANQTAVVTAGKFEATFTDQNRLATLHGEPDARIVSRTPGQPDRVSTSQSLDVSFRPAGGIASIAQQGDVAYVDGTRKAWAQRATYTPANQMLVLNGSPRVADSGMTTTAQVLRMNRATGDAIAEGSVKSTYTELKAQPDGGMLASADPIHVTSRTMTAHRTPAVAVYSGSARLWQNANIVESPSLQFDREHRSLLAQGKPGQAVSTVLVQVDKNGNATPVTITSAHLTYTDAERKMVFDGGVTAKGSDATMTAQQMNVFLLPRSQSATSSDSGGPGQVEKIIAQGGIVITQPSRRATGDRLVYTSADEKFVLTGGPPSIFDAERGKITGNSLTFFRRDDRVLVEGTPTSPTVTKTRVAR
ncbi:MAG: LPS export ABC transporter periplasmic protein LptC [Terriglobales bacterium]